jgi:iron complex transport system substrate-binding protein
VRIVSLLPSATEILFALGLGDEVVGVTHACDWPPEARAAPKVTHASPGLVGRHSGEIHRLAGEAAHGGSSLFSVDEAALAEAAPDLILTQELCDVCAVGYEEAGAAARRLGADTTVVSLEPHTLEGIFNTISTVGAMTEAEEAAMELVEELRSRLRAVEEVVLSRRDTLHVPPRVVAVEWLDPPFAVGHWVPEQIRRAGGWELLGREGERAAPTTWDAIRDVDPEMLLLMPCGFSLEDTIAEWGRTPRPHWWSELGAVRRGALVAVDGSAYFSRPGPRVIDGIELLAELFDPAAFDGIAPSDAWAPVD